MTYQNGREVKIGDSIVGEAYGRTVVGTVAEIRPGLRHFNIQVRVNSGGLISVTAEECLHAADARPEKTAA